MFSPKIDDILRRPKIVKPQEEFLLPVPPKTEASLGEGEDLTISVTQEGGLIHEMMEEAARLQELYDLVVDTADLIEVGVPPEDEGFLEKKTLSTQDYLAAIQDTEDPNSDLIRQHFEWGVLKDPGPAHMAWTVLAAHDLHDLRGRLLSAVGVMEGTLLAATQVTSGSPTWGRDAINSHLGVVGRSLLDGARDYRVNFLRSAYTGETDLRSLFLQSLLEPVTHVTDQELRRTLRKLADTLQTIRGLLMHAQILMAFEYFQVRDLLTSIIKKAVIEQLLHTMNVVLSQARSRFVEPILDLFEKGIDGRGPLRLADAVSQQIGSVLAGTVASLITQYNDLACDLVREAEREKQVRSQKVQLLGERNVVGRWIQHIDEALLLINEALAQGTLTSTIVQNLLDRTQQSPPRPASKFLDELDRLPGSAQFAQNPTRIRGFDESEAQRQEEQTLLGLAIVDAEGNLLSDADKRNEFSVPEFPGQFDAVTGAQVTGPVTVNPNVYRPTTY